MRTTYSTFFSFLIGVSFIIAAAPAHAQLHSQLEAVHEGKVLDLAMDEMLLSLTLINTAEKKLYFLRYTTPLAGFENNLLVVERNGKPIDYIGKLALRAAPLKEDWIGLEPGEELSMVFDLATAYDISQPGAYTVRYRAVQPIFAADSLERADHVGGLSAVVESNTVSLQVSGSPPPRAALPLDFGTQDVGCSQSQSDTARSAQAQVPGMASSAASASLADPQGFVVTWFGDAGFADQANANFTSIASVGGEYIDYTCTICGGSVIAYVYKNRPYQIWLCELFFQGGYGGDVILHEISHWNITVGADDVTYGCGNAQSLARSNPRAAQRNADNYRCAAL